MYNSQKHPFHLVTPSPWPFMASLSAFLITYGMVSYMHSFKNGGLIIIFGIFLFCFTLFVWWRDVVREATYEGVHTTAVQRGLRLGMLLFIVSEIMFFFAFFWAYFHSSLAPVVEIGSVWPSFGIVPFNPWGIPLLNTYILLLSGVTITYTHHYLTIGDFDKVVEGFVYTIALALVFTCFQAFEYFEAPFSISDSVYGSTFYMATGFHGFHVMIGTCFIIVCFIRLLNSHFTTQHHFGFEAAAWYWHFVDVVWLFLFISIYWWGSL